MSRRNDRDTGLLRNVSWSLVSKIFAISLKLLSVVALTRFLGAEEFGQVVWVLATTALLAILSDFGVSSSCSRLLADMPDAARAILFRSALLVGCLTSVSTASIFIFSTEIGALLGVPWLPDVRAYVALAVATQVWLRLVMKGFEGIARQDLYGRINLFVGWSPWILAAGGSPFWGVNGALAGYVLGNAATALGHSIVLYRAILAMDGERLQLWAKDAKTSFGAIASYAAPLMVTAASFYVFSSSDIMIIQSFASSAEVGIYGAAVRLVESVHVLAVAVGSGLAVYFVKSHKSGSGSDLLIQTTRVLLFIYAPVGIFMLYSAPEVVTAIFGAEYRAAGIVVQIYVPYLIIKGLTPTYSLALDYLGEAKKRAIAIGIAATANVLLNLLLVPRYGAAGAAIATQVTYLPIGIWYFRLLSTKVGGADRGYLSEMKPEISASIVMLAVLAAVRAISTSPFLLGVVGFVSYLLVYWRCGGVADMWLLFKTRGRFNLQVS